MVGPVVAVHVSVGGEPVVLTVAIALVSLAVPVAVHGLVVVKQQAQLQPGSLD
jgi:hypothetical protein